MLYTIAAKSVTYLILESEAQKFSRILHESLNATANIVTDIHENGYSKLEDLAYFWHKEIVENCNNNFFQTILQGGDNYSDRTMKHLQGLVWRASETKQLNIGFLIKYNTNSLLIEEWYNESMAEADKTKKEFELDTPEKFTYPNCRKWDKWVDNYISARFNPIGASLSYVIRRWKFPEMANLPNEIYKSNPEHCRMIASPITDAVYKRENSEVQKLLKSLTQGIESCKWIEKCSGVYQTI